MHFAEVSVEEAHAILREREKAIRDIREAAGGASPGPVKICIGEDTFEAIDDSGEIVSTNEPGGHARAEETRHAKVTVDGQVFEFDVGIRRGDLRPNGVG